MSPWKQAAILDSHREADGVNAAAINQTVVPRGDRASDMSGDTHTEYSVCVCVCACLNRGLECKEIHVLHDSYLKYTQNKCYFLLLLLVFKYIKTFLNIIENIS